MHLPASASAPYVAYDPTGAARRARSFKERGTRPFSSFEKVVETAFQIQLEKLVNALWVVVGKATHEAVDCELNRHG
jgi:hypothetical protein